MLEYEFRVIFLLKTKIGCFEKYCSNNANEGQHSAITAIVCVKNCLKRLARTSILNLGLTSDLNLDWDELIW